MEIPYSKSKNSTEAFEAVKTLLEGDIFSQYKISPKVDFDESDEIVRASEKGFKLVASFTDSSAKLDIKVSLLLRPFKGKIEGILKKELTKLL